MKKIAQTDAIFDHVAQANRHAADNPKSLRLSIDTKAKVKIGNLSRNGKDRTREDRKADDHDSEWHSVLVPFGILNLDNDELSIYFAQSAETSDFIVDCLAWWWQDNQDHYPEIAEWVINLDGGPATRSDRTQFIKRMVELAHTIALPIRLIDYPPYHRKYNAIERCWAALEHDWNGAILDSVEAAVQWASQMTWKAIAPVVYLVEGIDEKGVKVFAEALADYLPFWQWSETLPKWDITILPDGSGCYLIANPLSEVKTPEELLAALDRKVSSSRTPNLLPVGSLFLQPGEERQRTGSHYTPRKLTQPIVDC